MAAARQVRRLPRRRVLAPPDAWSSSTAASSTSCSTCTRCGSSGPSWRRSTAPGATWASTLLCAIGRFSGQLRDVSHPGGGGQRRGLRPLRGAARGGPRAQAGPDPERPQPDGPDRHPHRHQPGHRLQHAGHRQRRPHRRPAGGRLAGLRAGAAGRPPGLLLVAATGCRRVGAGVPRTAVSAACGYARSEGWPPSSASSSWRWPSDPSPGSPATTSSGAPSQSRPRKRSAMR